MAKTINLDKDFGLWWTLARTRDLMNRVRVGELIKVGITPREAAVLLLVKQLGGTVSVTQLAKWLVREPHSVRELAGRMEKQGLVARHGDPQTRKRTIVKLTPAGEKACRGANRRVSVRRILAALSEQEREQLGSSLRKLRAKALKELRIDSIPDWPQSW